MNHTQLLNRHCATIGWSALLIWWGIVMMIDPLTIGMGAMGTGVILLSVNASRLLNGIPPKESTTTAGIITLMWGAFDQARVMLAHPTALSFAMIFIVIGVVMLTRELFRYRKTGLVG